MAKYLSYTCIGIHEKVTILLFCNLFREVDNFQSKNVFEVSNLLFDDVITRNDDVTSTCALYKVKLGCSCSKEF